MITKISTADARKNFAEIVNKAAYGKESIVLTRRGKDLAALVSLDMLDLLQKLEDRLDIEEAEQAIAEPGNNIPAEAVWKELGL